MAVPESEITRLPVPNADEAPKDEPAPEPEPLSKPKTARLLSLDAFRGLTIMLMLLVNNIALDIYTPKHLMHAPWNGGVHLADLVAPWFLFCVGVAIPFSAASFARSGKPAWQYDLKVLKRGAILILLGCVIDSSLANRPVFCLDVLQLIGLAYMVGALLHDLPLSRRVGIAGLMLVGYWAAIKFVPVPGTGAGIFEENQNFIAHLNQTYLAPFNLNGLPSVVPTAALVMIGAMIGDILRRKDREPMWTVAWLMAAGLAMTIGGIAWNASLAFNKPVWTPSYILLSAGTGTLALGVLYLIIDAQKWAKWSYPLVVFGANAIVAYVAPILVKLWVLQRWHVGGPDHSVPVQQWWLDLLKAHLGPVPGGWFYTVVYMAVWWVVLWQMYRKKLFVRV